MNSIDTTKSLVRELVQINRYNLLACGYEKLDVSTAGAKSLANIPANARYMEIRLESTVTSGVALRYLLLGDTTLPTSTNGMMISNYTLYDIVGTPNLINFRVILAQAGTHTLHVQYYK